MSVRVEWFDADSPCVSLSIATRGEHVPDNGEFAVTGEAALVLAGEELAVYEGNAAAIAARMRVLADQLHPIEPGVASVEALAQARWEQSMRNYGNPPWSDAGQVPQDAYRRAARTLLTRTQQLAGTAPSGVEVVLDRDPDGATDARVFLDGVDVTRTSAVEAIDPGRGHSAAEWREQRDVARTGLTPAAAAWATQRYDDWADSSHIHDADHLDDHASARGQR